MDKTSPVTFSPAYRSHLRNHRNDKELIEEYIGDKLVEIVGTESAKEIVRAFQDAPEEIVELYQNTLDNKYKLFKGKKSDIARAKYTIGFSELLNFKASRRQFECWSDLFVWLEENGLQNAQATSGFIELARLQANDEETDMYKRIALVYLDTISDPTGETRESNLKEVTKKMISILQQEDISNEVKQDLLNEEIRKASDFAREEEKRILKSLGKGFFVGGFIISKVAAALALLG